MRTRGTGNGWYAALFLVACAAALPSRAASEETSAPDSRVRTYEYKADEIYHLEAYVGYQIDIEFESGETFAGLGAGDLGSLAYAAHDNHLFLKPRAPGASTNLTVLTSRRIYHFDYTVSRHRPAEPFADIIYVLRFSYPPPPAPPPASDIDQRLQHASEMRWHNLAYAWRGSPSLKPIAAWDDGVQTHLKFAAQQELPAIFARNADGSESLVNFSVTAGEVRIHRVAPGFILRRGRLSGCVVNQDFTGAGERLRSGTLSPSVERATRAAPAAREAP